MSRISRAVAAFLLVLSIAGVSGCILHTWTGTYQEYPESVYTNPHTHQGDPEPPQH